MITLKLDDSEDLAEALYYAQLAAVQVASDSPHSATPDVQWDALAADTKTLWRLTASRLMALHQAPEP